MKIEAKIWFVIAMFTMAALSYRPVSAQQGDPRFDLELNGFAVDVQRDWHSLRADDFFLVRFFDLGGDGLDLSGGGDGGGGSERFKKGAA